MEYDLKFDYAEALKRVNFSQSQVDVLRESAKKCAIVPKSLTNKQLLVFLNANEGDVDRATKMLVRHYEIRKKAPQLFTGRDITREELKKTLENESFLVLPPTPDHNLVCFDMLTTQIAKNTVYDNSTKCFLMMMYTNLYNNGPANGLILLYDIKNLTTSHLLRSNLRSMKKFFDFLQEGLPIKIHSVHIFNTVSFFNVVMKMIKPFISQELSQKLHLHSSSLDMEKFYAECVPRSCLPSDYGGVCESVEVLHEKMCEEYKQLREHLEAEEKQAALELDA